MCLWMRQRNESQQEHERLRREISVLRSALAKLQEKLNPWSLMDETSQKLAAQYECKLCMAKEIDAVFLPCGHCMSCKSCADSIDLCPVCMTKVTRITQVYMM